MTGPRHIPTLDGLRGFAALVVVWYHFPKVGESRLAEFVHRAAYHMFSGYVAVDIFFVLSGFLITRIILREITAGQFSVRNFLIKRALRILPIYYLTLLVVACLQPLSHQWVAAACFAMDYMSPFDASPHVLDHTWSLAVEEQFYLIWPLLFAFFPVTTVRRIAWPWGPVVALLGAAVTFLVFEPSLASGLVYRGLHCRMLSVLLGATFAFYEQSMRRWPGRLVGCGAIVGYVAVLLAVFGVRQTGWSACRWLSVLLSAGTSLLVVQFVVCANEQPNHLRRLLTSAPLLWAGKISYGIYLYHYVILFLLMNSGSALPPLPTTVFAVSVTEGVLALVLCLAIPSLSYLMIERPLLRLKSRLTTPRDCVAGSVA